MKRLYNEYEAMTRDGDEICSEADRFATEILGKYAKRGYSLRDAAQIIHSSVDGVAAYLVLKAAMEKRKAERSNK